MSWLAPWAFPPNSKTDESFPNPKSEPTYKENIQTSCHCLLVLFTSKLNKMTSKFKPKKKKILARSNPHPTRQWYTASSVHPPES
jgi:hypothetical protein